MLSTENNSQKISLKEFMLKAEELFWFYVSKWRIFFLCGIFSIGLALMYYFLQTPKYTSTTTFVLTTDSKSGGGGLASLAGQLGVDLGSGGEGAFTGENIIELFKSKLLLKRALFTTIPEKKKLLVNYFAEVYGHAEKWSKNPYLASSFPFPDKSNKITPIQDSLLSEIHTSILEKFLSSKRKDKRLSFYEVSTISKDQYISTYLTKFLVAETSSFYIETKTFQAKANVELLQREADSLRSTLRGLIVASASAVDRTYNLNPALQAQRAEIQQNQSRASVIGPAYGEVVKNLEIAKINLQRETPLFQIIDSQELPLRKQKKGLLGLLISFGLSFVFITAAALLIKWLNKD